MTARTPNMDGLLQRFYLHETQRCRERPAWEWLLAQARELGVRGGSAFRAMAGFGRQHHVQQDTFFEWPGTLTIAVEFIVTDNEARCLLDQVRQDKLRAFVAQMPARFGTINPDQDDVATAAIGELRND